MPERILTMQAAAQRALDGVGDACLGEWPELGVWAVHLRRRVTATEWGDRPWGQDYRGTWEGQKRLGACRKWLPPDWTE